MLPGIADSLTDCGLAAAFKTGAFPKKIVYTFHFLINI